MRLRPKPNRLRIALDSFWNYQEIDTDRIPRAGYPGSGVEDHASRNDPCVDVRKSWVYETSRVSRGRRACRGPGSFQVLIVKKSVRV
jgi:hypothetical protein